MGYKTKGLDQEMDRLLTQQLTTEMLIDLRDHAAKRSAHGNTKTTEKKLQAMAFNAVNELIQFRRGERVRLEGTVS